MWDFDRWESKTAVITQSGRTYTYNDISNICKEFAGRITPEILLYVSCEINVETIIGYVSAISNHIPVMMSEDNNIGIIETYLPAYIWQSQSIAVPDQYVNIWEYGEYVLCKRTAPAGYDIDSRLALLLSTSGSTGSRKFVRISYENLITNTESIINSLGISDGDRAMVMLPLNYTYGLSIINTHLYMGATLLIPDVPLIHKTFWDFLRDSGGTSICGVPYTYEVIKKLRLLHQEIPSLRIATQAGGKLTPNLERYMYDLSVEQGWSFAVMYGQTEATARMSCHIVNEHPDKMGSAGVAVKGGHIEIDSGEIVYFGKNVSLGYAQGFNDLCKGDDNNGILHTGDRGYLDEDGYLYVTGRNNRFAKINGYRINLDEVEQALEERYRCEAACIEADNRIVILTNCSDVRADEVIRIKENLLEIRYTANIPRKENGKKDYSIIDMLY